MEVEFVGKGDRREVRDEVRTRFRLASLRELFDRFCLIGVTHAPFVLFLVLNASVQFLCFTVQSVDTVPIDFRAKKHGRKDRDSWCGE